MATKEQVRAAVAIAEAIREAKRVPYGELYAVVMGAMDLDTLESFVQRLIGAGLVAREGNELVWVGPEV